MKLRDYQQSAIDAVYAHLRERDDNPLIVIPTGGGKTPVIASICSDAVEQWQGRVLVLAHVKELLAQTVSKLDAVAPGLGVGVYSAGLGRRELTHAVTIAGIQSIWQRAGELGPVDLVIVDEAHLIPPDYGEGMYRAFLADAKLVNPLLRVIGLTATPFRMRTGMICAPDGILNHICYEVGVRSLIDRGFLAALKSKSGRVKVDTSQLALRCGEFVASEVEEVFDTDEIVERACAEIADETKTRASTLLFAAGIAHGRHIVSVLRERHGIECGWVDGNTSASERASCIDRFRSGELRYLANVNVLTTGFDAPNVDCVALLRPTASAGLYYQMVGRGFRVAPGKEDCLILDFGGNVMRHGPVDDLQLRARSLGTQAAPMKECDSCHALVATATRKCPECGFAFPEPERTRHEARATTAEIIRTNELPQHLAVSEVRYCEHFKRDDEYAPPTLRVEYRISFTRWVREWLCIEHPLGSFPRRKAEVWWRARSNAPCPQTVAGAIALAESGALAHCSGIVVTRPAGEQYDRIASHELGVIPEYSHSSVGTHCTIPDDEIPF